LKSTALESPVVRLNRVPHVGEVWSYSTLLS